ncbi:MAG: carbohydrate kinase family protein, partial [Casimicrobiaceae bacterium]
MRTLICGSLAFDTIMVFPDRFGRHILPDQTHMLSVSFTVGDMRREWGGCAGNIAYNLRGLGGEPVVMATLGKDGGDYRERLATLGIGIDGVRDIDDLYTAQAFIITDLDDNQITAFHPGAMARSHDNRVADVADIGIGIVAPDGREGMLAHAAGFAAANIPFIFDPGQAMTLFSGDELLRMVDAASVVTLNDYETRLLEDRTGLARADIAARVDAMIVTMGAEGSLIHAGSQTLRIGVA